MRLEKKIEVNLYMFFIQALGYVRIYEKKH